MYYKTKDGESFNNEQEGQNHANGLGYMDEGFSAGQRGDYDEAISYYDLAIPLLSGRHAFTYGRSKGIAYMNRGFNHQRKGNYDQAIEDCNAALLYPGVDYQNKANAYNIRGAAYNKKGNKEQAIADWKKAVDTSSTSQGGKNALNNLADLGIQYTPQKPQSSSSSSSSYSEEPRGVFLSVVFGLIGGIGLFTTFGWIYVQLGGTKTISSILLILLMIAIGTVITFLSWRNRWKLFFVIIPLALFGWLVAFGIIPERIVGIKSATTQTQTATATVNANVNFRKEPTTGDNIIRQLQQGDTVTLTGEVSGGWTQIKHNGDTGWISTEYLKK